MPARCAPSTFSFTPPIGSTRPRSVISPVIATSLRTGRPDIALTRAPSPSSTPADGPSFGIAPAGTCTCTSIEPSRSSGICSCDACVAAYVSAARADSFITSPSWPVRISDTLPHPLTCVFSSSVERWPQPCSRRIAASTNMMSPPAGV